MGWDVVLGGWEGGSFFGRPVAPVSEMLTWDIVNIAAVHEPVAVLGVAERRQVGGIRRTGSDVAPKAACQRERTRSRPRGDGPCLSTRWWVTEDDGTAPAGCL